MTNSTKAPHDPNHRRISPTLRLVAVIVFTSACVWIERLEFAALALIIGLIAVLIVKNKSYMLLFVLTVPTFVFYFLGNYLFSPASYGGLRWWIFRFNEAGLHAGLVGGLKRDAMISFSLGWLWSTSLPELYDSVAAIPGLHNWALLFLRNIQTIRREFVIARQSLLLREPRLRRFQLLTKIKRTQLLLQAILLRTFSNIATITYAAETHHVARQNPGRLELSKVWVWYGPQDPVLKDVNLMVKPGEFVYVAGRNGAGKSTLLRVISGYIPRIKGGLSGLVAVGGNDTSSLSLRDIADFIRFVPSDPLDSIIGLTVGQDVVALAQDKEQARRCLSIMNIEDLWERETTKLSGGEQARLVLAGALASKVGTVLLDCPLEQLDLEGRKEFLTALDELVAHHKQAVVIADPFFEHLKPYVDRLVLIEDGKVSYDATIETDASNAIQQAGPKEIHPYPLVRPSRGDSPLAEMKNVEVRLENVLILSGIDLQIFPGENVAVVGYNGSGKTTALQTLAGILRPSSGKVIASGKIRYAFQDPYSQMVGLTSRDELALGPMLHKWSPTDIREFADDHLAWIGLGGRESPIDLHPGKARLLSIAAMSFECDLLVLDEPTLGLDDLQFSRLVTFLAARPQIATAIITHDIRVARLASRAIVMDRGRIVANCMVEEAFAIMKELGKNRSHQTKGPRS